MSDLRDLYQEVILDHSKRPRNFGRLPDADRSARGDNPLCGDRLDLTLTLADGKVERVAFEGAGCAISVASASLMTEAVTGRPVAEVEELFARFRAVVAGDAAPSGDEEAAIAGLGKLAVFAGVREYPIRVKCATLPWHTLHAALAGATNPEAAAADVMTAVTAEVTTE